MSTVTVSAGELALARVRPATLRRIEKLKALAAELSMRQLNIPAAAQFLCCSTSSARQYLIELCEAGAAVAPCDEPADAHHRSGPHYRLHDDHAQAQQALEMLADAIVWGRLSSKGSRQPQMFLGGRCFHIMADDVKFALDISTVTAQRDPLVAALFGPCGCNSSGPA